MKDAPVYLDNNATTMLAPEALEAMLPFLREEYGNAGSAHILGRLSEGAVVHAREQLAGFLGCQEAELVFNSGGTEGLNHAIRGVFEASPGRRHFITTAVEHSAVLAVADWLKRQGVELTVLGVDQEGRLDLAELEAALRPDTALVSVMAANNESGVLFPLAEAGALAKARGALFHVDGTQAVGKVPIDLSRLPVDLFNLSSHKFHGPKGIGALFVRRGLRLKPFMLGGGQERGRRGGTENVAGIVGLGQAAAMAGQHLETMDGRVRALRDRLEAGILDQVTGVRVNGAGAERLPNTSFLSFQGIEGEALFLKLSDRGVCVSTGSACSTGQREPSHVLRAMGIPAPEALGTVRFSLSRYTTEAEILKVTELVPGLVAELRASGALGRR
jgi:cysteine desulfurase